MKALNKQRLRDFAAGHVNDELSARPHTPAEFNKRVLELEASPAFRERAAAVLELTTTAEAGELESDEAPATPPTRKPSTRKKRSS